MKTFLIIIAIGMLLINSYFIFKQEREIGILTARMNYKEAPIKPREYPKAHHYSSAKIGNDSCVVFSDSGGVAVIASGGSSITISR